MKRIVLFLGLLLVAALGMAQTSPMAVNYDTYKTGQYSNERQFKTYTIRSQDEFEDYWYKTTGNSRRTAPTDVNWTQSELLAIHLGQRPSGGYSVYVGGITPITAHNYRVSIVEQKPARGRMQIQAITSPFVIIRLPRRFASYEFAREVVEAPTGNPDPRPRPQTCNCPCCTPAHSCCNGTWRQGDEDGG